MFVLNCAESDDVAFQTSLPASLQNSRQVPITRIEFQRPPISKDGTKESWRNLRGNGSEGHPSNFHIPDLTYYFSE